MCARSSASLSLSRLVSVFIEQCLKLSDGFKGECTYYISTGNLGYKSPLSRKTREREREIVRGGGGRGVLLGPQRAVSIARHA